MVSFFSFLLRIFLQWIFFFCLHVHSWKCISRRNTGKIPQLKNLISVDILTSNFLFSFVFSLVKYENIYFLIISTKTEHLNLYIFLFYYIFHFVYFPNQTKVIFYKFFVCWWNWMFLHMLFPFEIFLQIIFYNIVHVSIGLFFFFLIFNFLCIFWIWILFILR